jgi:serine/threonine protein phosphatase PrpC
MAGVTLTVCGQSDPGVVRKSNEDAWLLANLSDANDTPCVGAVSLDVGEDGVLIAVSDGMGGAQAGEVASALVLESLQRRLRDKTTDGTTPERLRKAVEGANVEVCEAAQAPGREGMGATLTAILVRGTTAYIAEVGDSRAYLLRGMEMQQITRDQSYVQLLVDSGLLEPEKVRSFPGKNVLLQAMGQEGVVVEISKVELRAGDRILICSDGLYGMIYDDEIRETLLSTSTLEEKCTSLIAAANARGGVDNISVVVAEATGGELSTRSERPISATLEMLHVYRSSQADELAIIEEGPPVIDYAGAADDFDPDGAEPIETSPVVAPARSRSSAMWILVALALVGIAVLGVVAMR